jgi:hypothetical protein
MTRSTNPIAREPDEAMIEAGTNAAWGHLDLCNHRQSGVNRAVEAIYLAMEAARAPTKDRETASPASEAFIGAVQSAQTKLDDLRTSLNGDPFGGSRLSIFATDLEALLFAACRAPTAASPAPRDTLVEAAQALLKQWESYLDSDLNQMNAHDILVRYDLWKALDAALNSTQQPTDRETDHALR